MDQLFKMAFVLKTTAQLLSEYLAMQTELQLRKIQDVKTTLNDSCPPNITCSDLESEGMWYKSITMGEYGGVKQKLRIKFEAYSDPFGIKKVGDVEIVLEYITDGFEEQSYNTWIKVTIDGTDAIFSGYGLEWFAPGRISNYPELILEERDRLLGELKIHPSWQSSTHYEIAEKCIRVIHSNLTDLDMNP